MGSGGQLCGGGRLMLTVSGKEIGVAMLSCADLKCSFRPPPLDPPGALPPPPQPLAPFSCILLPCEAAAVQPHRSPTRASSCTSWALRGRRRSSPHLVPRHLSRMHGSKHAPVPLIVIQVETIAGEGQAFSFSLWEALAGQPLV